MLRREKGAVGSGVRNSFTKEGTQWALPELPTDPPKPCELWPKNIQTRGQHVSSRLPHRTSQGGWSERPLSWHHTDLRTASDQLPPLADALVTRLSPDDMLPFKNAVITTGPDLQKRSHHREAKQPAQGHPARGRHGALTQVPPMLSKPSSLSILSRLLWN